LEDVEGGHSEPRGARGVGLIGYCTIGEMENEK
jgi:hypothetical protein